MARLRGEIKIMCQNPACKYFLKEKRKDIVKRGKNRTEHQQYYCNHCHKWFTETANTPLYYKHLSSEEILKICKFLVEKNGIRSIERITGHHRDTIGRVLEDLAEHAFEMNDILIKNLRLTPIECDELWTFVKKDKKINSLSTNSFEECDAWIYIAIKRHTYFFIAFEVGKWTQDIYRSMIEQLFRRSVIPSSNNKIEIFKDGKDDYNYILKEYYSNINYEQIVKIRENGRLIRKEKRIIYGEPDLEATIFKKINGVFIQIFCALIEYLLLLMIQSSQEIFKTITEIIREIRHGIILIPKIV
ncbi:MAG: IS1 family transposase [Candidatus Micrarchaeaceae archaeon]